MTPLVPPLHSLQPHKNAKTNNKVMNTTSLKDGLLSISKEESLAAMEYHAKLENDGTLGETYGYLADKFPAISTALDLENGHYLTDCILGRELLSGMRYVAVVVAIVAELRAEKSFETTILSIPPNALADACFHRLNIHEHSIIQSLRRPRYNHLCRNQWR